MEGQLLYLSRRHNNDIWKIQSIPISQAYIDSEKPHSPSASQSHESKLVESLVDELSKLCGENGAMKGWKLHSLGDPELSIESMINRERKYWAKAILTRPMEPLAPNTSKIKPVPDVEKKNSDGKPKLLSEED